MRAGIAENLPATTTGGGTLRLLFTPCTRSDATSFFSLLLVAALCASAALLSACARNPDRPTEPTSALSCRPPELRPGDTLELTLRTPHGGYLGVIAPRDFWFFLVYPHQQPNQPSLMPASKFGNVARLALPVSSTKALPWVHGYNEAMLVFRKAGTYKIVVGENLLSHDYPVSSCTVTFLAPTQR